MSSSCDAASATSATNQKLIMDTIGKINTMVTSVGSNCDPGSTCYTDKTRNELLQIYNDAKRTELTAPGDKDIAKENYYKFILGDGYAEFQEKEAEKEAGKFISEITNVFFVALNKSVVTLEDYINLLNDIKYAKTLDALVEGGESFSGSGSSDDGQALSQTLDIYLQKTNNTTNLNERKVYYEQENYDLLVWWYKVWLYTYIFLLVILLISIFLVDNKNTFMTNMGILTLFVAYIFIAKPILYFIVYIVKQINTFLPKNVYLSLNS